MKFFVKCVAIFILLTILLTVADALLLDTQIPLSATALFSAFASLLLTILYGWIDAVYIKQRQPGFEE
jgi:hypothetical protein